MASTMGASEGNLEEPKTPMWLPAVGAVLFLTIALLWGLSGPSKDATPAPTTADAGAAH
jgi:hypothetical protein